MNTILAYLSWAFDPRLAALWAFLGALIISYLDKLYQRWSERQKLKSDSGNAQLAHVNEATKLLIDSLMAQVASLHRMTGELQDELRETHRMLDEKIERVLQLEDEVIMLRREVQNDTSGRRRNAKQGVGQKAEQQK